LKTVWVKALVVLALPWTAHAVSGVVPAAAWLLMPVHGIAICSLGWAAEIVLGLRRSRDPIDQLSARYVTGWCVVPLLALAACCTPGWRASPLVLSLALLVAACWKRGRTRADRPPAGAPVPAAVYLLALGFALVFVALPFRFFHEGSIVRELYGDGLQRFSATYALAHEIPPACPFLHGAPLSYYWLAFLPFSLELRWVHGDLFAIWKCGQILSAFFFAVALWQLLAETCGRRFVAWTAVVLGLFASSYEIWSHPPSLAALMDVVRQLLHGERIPWQEISLSFPKDPDHIAAIVTRSSDGLLLEDFLYIPQNAAALFVVMSVLRCLERGRHAAALAAASTLAGFNTFYVFVVFPPLVLLLLAEKGWAAAGIGAAALVAGGSLWLAVCRILPLPLWGTGLLAVLSLGLWKLAGDRCGAGREPNDLPALPLRLAGCAAWAGLLLLLLPFPLLRLKLLLLNYGPAIPLGMAFLAGLIIRPGTVATIPVRRMLFVLLVAVAAHWVIASFLLAQSHEQVPALLRQVSQRVGQTLNAFNFYHKTAKLTRLAWVILAALGAAAAWSWLIARSRRWRIVLVGAALLICMPACLTGVVRAVTYMRTSPVPERAAGRYLRQHGANPDTVVLLEDTRWSAINMLAPVSTYVYCTWTGAETSITEMQGPWAGQYTPAAFRREITAREARCASVFSPPLNRQALRELLGSYRIDYLLTRYAYDLSPDAEMVVSRPYGYLYRVQE